VLDHLGGLAHYYIYTMTSEFMQPMTFTQAQDR
jgi:hypothetical protein